METKIRDHYLATLGITQWVSKSSCASMPASLWQKIGSDHHPFAFIVDYSFIGFDCSDEPTELLRKMIIAVGQDPQTTAVYSSAASTPDGLPLVLARHVIVLGHAQLLAQAPAAYYFAPSLNRLLHDVEAKRTLWVALKNMMNTHA